MARQLLLVAKEHNEADYDAGLDGSGAYIYKLNDKEFIRIKYTTNSYDSDMNIVGVDVVQGKEKTVVVYE